MRSSIVGNPEYGKAVFMYYFEDGEEIDIDFERVCRRWSASDYASEIVQGIGNERIQRASN
jgi:hypothetical protein